MKKSQTPLRGYKVFKQDFTCNGYQYAENTEFVFDGEIEICSRGFHFCEKAAHCFSYYDFTPENIVCEVEGRGKIMDHGEDSKHCTDVLFVGQKLTWNEVLIAANEGKNNTGHSNSGDRNSGDRNSGYRNSGDSNSGDSNSGDSNSGDSNSGNWNSGYRNSGDSNSGYRNAGAFCTENDPILYLFNKRTNITIRQWEEHEAIKIMSENLDFTLWVPQSQMTEEEKKLHEKYETTEGYLKSIPVKEAWANMWYNLNNESKKVFTDLPNFDAEIFEEITGIDVKK